MTLHASYALSHDRAAMEPDPDDPNEVGVWRAGLAISYYVPFFDFD